MGGLMGDTKLVTNTDTSCKIEIEEVTDDLPNVYNLKNILTRTGTPLFINIGLATICLILILVSFNENDGEFRYEWDVLMYLSAAGITTILLIAILYIIIIRRFFGLSRYFNILFIAMCVACIILLLVGSVAVAANVQRSDGRRLCRCPKSYCPSGYYRDCRREWNGDIAAAAAAFGFLTTIGILVQLGFHACDLKSNFYADNLI